MSCPSSRAAGFIGHVLGLSDHRYVALFHRPAMDTTGIVGFNGNSCQNSYDTAFFNVGIGVSTCRPFWESLCGVEPSEHARCHWRIAVWSTTYRQPHDRQRRRWIYNDNTSARSSRLLWQYKPQPHYRGDNVNTVNFSVFKSTSSRRNLIAA